MDSILIGVLILLFVAVFLAAEGGFDWWTSSRGPEAKRIAKRLRAMSAGGHLDSESASVLKERLLSDSPSIQRLLLQMPRVTSLDRLLVQGGSNMTVSGFIAITGGLFAATLLVGLAMRFPLLLVLPIAALIALIPFEIVVFKRNRRVKRFEQLLPEALDLIGRALRAGHSFSSALQMAGNELPEPIGEEMRQTFDEINFGVPTNTALENLVSRMPSIDLSFFAIAVMIQRESGGNLSEVLDNISSIIRERLKLFGKVRTLSAEGRYSAGLLSILPFITAALLYMLNPEMMSNLWTTPIGQRLAITGIVMMLLGMLWMRKIIKIRV